jgi:hypothetical protein
MIHLFSKDQILDPNPNLEKKETMQMLKDGDLGMEKAVKHLNLRALQDIIQMIMFTYQ